MYAIDILSGPVGTATASRVVYSSAFTTDARIHFFGSGLTVDGAGVIDGGTITAIRLYDHTGIPPTLLSEARFTGGIAGSQVADAVNVVTPLVTAILGWADFYDSPFVDLVSVTPTEAIVEKQNGTFVRLTGTDFVAGTFAVGTVTAIEHLASDQTTVLNAITGISITSLAASAAINANPFALYEALTGGQGRVIVHDDAHAFFAGLLDGGLGNDRIDGLASDSSFFANRSVTYNNAVGDVNVDLDIGDGSGRATGGAGLDALYNIDHVFGSAFNDDLIGDGNSNLIEGNFGNDIIHGEGGSDFLNGSEGNDQVFGGEGSDFLEGGEGDDLLDGGLDADVVRFELSQGPITVDLRIEGVAQNTGEGLDTLVSIEDAIGSEFDDVIEGTNGANFLNGWFGNDVVFGRGGSDLIIGGDGDDVLRGGGGDDIIVGGGGIDSLNGGAGADEFNLVFSGYSKIFDFESGVDRISLLAFGAPPVEPLPLTNFFIIGSGVQDADDVIVYNQATGRLYYDANADGAGLGQLVALLGAGTTLAASDISTDFLF